MSNEILGLLALAALFAAIFIGFPIAFTLGPSLWAPASSLLALWCLTWRPCRRSR
jgi:hypothetical protein